MPQDTTIKQLRFQKIVEEIDDFAILLLDENGMIENWNKGAEKIKGYTAREIIGKSFRIFYTPEDLAENLPDKLLNLAATTGKANQEGWRVKKDGTRFWGSISITAIHDGQHNVIGYTKITRDLTRNKLAQEKLRRSEERNLKMVAEVQDYAILVMDDQGNIENWNKGAEKIKGYTAGEIIGKNFRQFYTPEDLANDKPGKLLEIARRQGRATDEGWRVRKDGSLFWGSITLTALHDDANNVIGFSKVTRDLTDKKRMEDALLYAQKMEAKNKELEQLTYITSHDLQEPLRNITSLSQILEETLAPNQDEEVKAAIRFINESAGRMHLFINGLLEYGRLGRSSVLSEVNTNNLVEHVVSDLHYLIKETQAQINYHNLPVLKGYETELRMLFQNLIGNAIKFRKPGVPPVISVTAEEQQGEWRFAVADNGIGIDRNFAERIFIIFQRLHAATDYEGSGIGLAQCKRIVELHNGRIWVESEPGNGATFIFTINTNAF